MYIKVKGYFDTCLSLKGENLVERVYVSQASNDGLSILSRKACRQLKIVTINIPKENLVKSVGSLKREGTSYHPLLEQFKDITIGIGCYNAHEISLPLKPDSKPVAASASRIPIPLQAKVKAELDRLTEAGVFEDVPVDDNTQFVSRLVPVPKKIPGSDELGVRLTMDWRELNRCLDAVHQEVPTFDQLRHNLSGARFFSKLDFSSAFFSLSLITKAVDLQHLLLLGASSAPHGWSKGPSPQPPFATK